MTKIAAQYRGTRTHFRFPRKMSAPAPPQESKTAKGRTRTQESKTTKGRRKNRKQQRQIRLIRKGKKGRTSTKLVGIRAPRAPKESPSPRGTSSKTRYCPGDRRFFGGAGDANPHQFGRLTTFFSLTEFTESAFLNLDSDNTFYGRRSRRQLVAAPMGAGAALESLFLLFSTPSSPSRCVPTASVL